MSSNILKKEMLERGERESGEILGDFFTVHCLLPST